MGCVATLVLITIRRELTWSLFYDALLRTFKSTGTILWITFGATALAGAYTIAGGPTYIAGLILGADMPTMGILLVDDADLPAARHADGLGRHRAPGHARIPAHHSQAAGRGTGAVRRARGFAGLCGRVVRE